ADDAAQRQCAALRGHRHRLRAHSGDRADDDLATDAAAARHGARLREFGPRGLALGAADDVHQLLDLSPLIGLVAGGNRMLHTMGDVIAQDLLLHAPHRRAHRRNLRHDVDAVAILVDHARDAAHLAFDPAQALGAGRLDVFAHARYIPP